MKTEVLDKVQSMTASPKGYKQTEVGLIPEDWEVSRLDSFFSFISYGFTNPMPVSNDGVYLITAANIFDGKIQYSTSRFTTETAYKKLLTDKSRPRKNDILLTKDGSLGRLAIVEDERICINQSVAVIRPNEKVLPEFLKKLLESNYYQKVMIDNAGGSTIKHLYITVVNLMLIGVPSDLSEQTAIATALSDADALIRSLEQLIEKKKKIKQGAMQELLTGKRRLQGFEKNLGIKQTEVGMIPCDWQVFNVRSITRFHKQGYYTNENYQTNGKYLLLRGTDMQNPEIKLETTPQINSSSFDYESYKVLPDDLLIVRSGAIGRYGIVTKNMPPAMFGSYLINFRFTDIVSPYYFGYFYQSTLAVSQIKAITQGGGNLNINAENIKSLLIPLPPSKAEQNAISNTLDTLESELVKLELKLEKYRKIKQGMMQTLLTGKIRLI